MADMVLMPQLGISEETAVLSQWYVQEGDPVRQGQRLFALETGKSSFDFESEFEGTVLALLAAEGDELPIQTPVCVIGRPGEKFEGAVAPAAKSEPEEAPVKTAFTAEPAVPAAPAAFEDGRLKISPRAKNLAAKAGIDPSGIAPGGPEGRIIERDVEKYLNEGRALEESKAPAPSSAKAPAGAKPESPAGDAEQKAAAPAVPGEGYADVPLTKIRKIIAENMHRSLAETAQLTLNASFDAAALTDFRRAAKAGAAPGLEGISFNDLVLFAVSRIILSHPDMNAHFLGDRIRRFGAVNLGFACDTDRGLMVPVIKNADALSLPELSKRAKELAAACRSGNISPDDLKGGTFTVTNLGALGVESFTPVINPPETGILGVCAMRAALRLAPGGTEYYTAMGLSLTFDHRAVDGAPAARFLKALCGGLEGFPLLLV